jgi:DNA (cytosine-5)-methyltransferase 1
MKYLSVCSGIEAATVAWHQLGFKPVGFSEIEKFPSQVLTHHYPNVNNYGDMTKYKEWDIGTIDILVGGTPCQSFSVAGLRQGMQDPRGNLALTYCGILDRFKPKWFVWENVPGVLSSNGGRDFGSLLGAVAELGYGFAYRVLDAQNFGVPQRRRRVFVVGYLGDWRRAAEVLFEPESLCWDIKTSRKKGQDVTACASSSTSVSVNNHEECLTAFRESSFHLYAETPVAGTIRASGGALAGGSETFVTKVYESHPNDSRIKEMGNTCQTVTSRWGTGGGNVPIALQGAGASSQNANGSGFKEDLMYTLNCVDVHGVCLPINTMTRQVRRLTPIECERLQGFPDGYTDIQPNGKPTADGSRYKALGNSMAVPVMKWIGERIKQVDLIKVQT